MKTNFLKVFGLAGIMMVMNACGGGTDVVESGTYDGTVKKVVPEEREIYVETADDKTLELYFTDQTTLNQNGQTVDFSTLEEGQNVQVEVEKVGQRLDPISVRILD